MKLIYRFYLCVLILSISFTPLPENYLHSDSDEIILTFITANDGHWRLPEISLIFDRLNRELIDEINSRGDVDFVIFNGDLVDRYAYIDWWNQNNPADSLFDRESRFNISWLYDVKEIYNMLNMPYYTVQGNHDRATWEYWEEVWGYPARHYFVTDDYAFVLLSRHDDRRIYHEIDYDWLHDILDANQHKKGIFIFIHAGDSGVMNETFRSFIQNYSNVRGMFFGHSHLDEMKTVDGLYYFWNGNFMNPIVYYGYRVVYIYESGKIDTYFQNLWSDTKTNRVTFTTTSVTDHVNPAIPMEFIVNQNYPNPFNPSTKISYAVPEISHVTLSIYNIAGQKIETIVDRQVQPGRYETEWTPEPSLSSGVYVYRFIAHSNANPRESFIKNRKMIYLR